MPDYPALLTAMSTDSAHDVAHLQRVVSTARKLAKAYNDCDGEVVEAAAWLHDLVNFPKDHPRRHQASTLSAQAAFTLLEDSHLSDGQRQHVMHAIEAHSFSAGIEPLTLEAKIVQDADRLDALGAIGLARTFMVGGMLQRQLYAMDDPFCQHREPDDTQFGIDHFFTKLLTLENSFKTDAGRQEAKRRTQFMRDFLCQLSTEIDTFVELPSTQ